MSAGAVIVATAEDAALLCLRREIFRPEHLANFGLAFPARPVFLVKLHKALCPFDRFFFRLEVEDRIPADDFLGLGEGPVDRADLSLREPDARAHCSWG